MKHTRKSRILFGSLLLIVVFFTGLNIGKHIERVDKTYVPPAPTPTPLSEPMVSPTPPARPATNYSRFTFKVCGVSFLLPSSFEPRTTAEAEIELVSGTDRVFATCEDTFVAEQEKAFPKQPTATSSASIASQKITTFKTKTTHLWIIRNKARQRVLFETSLGITPLIQETLELQ